MWHGNLFIPSCEFYKMIAGFYFYKEQSFTNVIIFQYASNGRFSNENKTMISFTIASKSPRHLGIFVPKEVQGVRQKLENMSERY